VSCSGSIDAAVVVASSSSTTYTENAVGTSVSFNELPSGSGVGAATVSKRHVTSALVAVALPHTWPASNLAVYDVSKCSAADHVTDHANTTPPSSATATEPSPLLSVSTGSADGSVGPHAASASASESGRNATARVEYVSTATLPSEGSTLETWSEAAAAWRSTQRSAASGRSGAIARRGCDASVSVFKAASRAA